MSGILGTEETLFPEGVVLHGGRWCHVVSEVSGFLTLSPVELKGCDFKMCKFTFCNWWDSPPLGC